MLELDH